jgi:glycogen operon protein
MVQHLHDAGIEVILDVVYNHTAEGSELGPTLSFRGIDNASYYRLVPGQRRYYLDFTGCGNALDLRHPRVLQLVMDSLRYWVEEMHVDGFRFDLATTLAREGGAFDEHSGFLDAVRQDPVLSAVKLIAEPWDVGEGGYQLGRFPPGWSEWNDRYRNTVRRFWIGEPGLTGELASRITGSADLFAHGGRRPWASINFVTAHDGFTLRDLVSYDQKHNEANGEDSRDGANDNHSWNCGVEGPTDDPGIRALRLQQSKNLLATLLLSQGVPMLLAGDEIGRSQGGNNNAYCQDNEISWTDWKAIGGSEGYDDEHELLDFVRQLIRLRRRHIAFHRQRFFSSNPERKDILWLRPDGGEMEQADWENDFARTLAFLLRGDAHGYHLTVQGDPESDDDFFVILNAHDHEVVHRLPGEQDVDSWEPVLETANVPSAPLTKAARAGSLHPAPARSVTVFVRRSGDS